MTWKDIFIQYMHNEDGVSEIEANGYDSIFIKHKGVRKKLDFTFGTEEVYEASIKQLIEDFNLNGGDEFLAEGRATLETGESARVHIVLPPAADTPQLTVAIKTQSLTSLERIRMNKSMDMRIYNFLVAAVKSNCTMVLSGGTGAGKTTMLEALTKHFDDMDRVGVCEDSPELILAQENVTYLHSTVWRPGMSTNDVATLSWCVQQLNRQRVDKIIIGETRGAEFADFVIAANSGCEGSLSTIHSNDAKSAVRKMGNFVMEGSKQSIRVANENISQTINFVIQLGRNKKGEHRILEIAELTQTLSNTESASISLQVLFSYNDETDSWTHRHVTDRTRERFIEYGIDPLTYELPKSTQNPTSTAGLPSFFKGGE